ncbi:MAG: hypothetical protein ABEJ78_06770, partial [Haloferacaceae archaeon]
MTDTQYISPTRTGAEDASPSTPGEPIMNRANGWCLAAVLTVFLTVSALASAGMFVQVASAASETVTL